MNAGEAPLPGYARFAWMFFMQPLSLCQSLLVAGIDEPNISAWRWWRRRKQLHPAYRAYGRRLVALPFLVPFVIALLALVGVALVDAISALELPVAGITARVLGGTAVGTAVGVAVGVAGGVALGVAGGVALGVGFGVAGGVALGVATGVAGGVLFGIEGGILFGMVLGLSDSVEAAAEKGATRSLAVTVAALVSTGVGVSVAVGLAVGVAVGVAEGIAFGVAMGVARVVSCLHLPLYPFECLMQTLLHLFAGREVARALYWSPVLFHDLSYLPLPFLARDIVTAAPSDPELVRRALDACALIPGQQRAGRLALAELQARELAELIASGRFADALALQGQWLPGRDPGNDLLRAFAEAARFLAAAEASHQPHRAQQHLRDVERQLAALDNLRLQSREPLARFVAGPLAAFRRAVVGLQEQSAQAAATQLPNPFVTGQPLSAALYWGLQVFRGREDVVRQVEGLLGERLHGGALALIGPRRCGKSSLLNMFRLLLPDTQIVLFDLQDNPATTPAAFYAALVRQASEQAFADRRLRLPPLLPGAPIEALRAWLQALEEMADAPRFLVCIDEFERLPSLFPSTGNELLQFMGLLRATIQHRRRVRLLVAGAAPFDELDALWNDHFINLREIRVGYLDRQTAIDLLQQPIPEFPLGTIPKALAASVVARTGGQPFLTQLYGSLLVDQLNDEQRRTASAADLQAVEEAVLEQAAYYFRNVWGDLPPLAQAVVAAAAQGHPLPADHAMRRILQRRQLMGDNGEFLVPVFGRWICERLAPL